MDVPVAHFDILSTTVLAPAAFFLSFLRPPLSRTPPLPSVGVDSPDSSRKHHPAPVPRIGGVPIVLAYAGAFAVLALIGLQGSLRVQLPLPLLWKLLPAGVLVFATGFADDLIGLKPWRKLLYLTAAAA